MYEHTTAAVNQYVPEVAIKHPSVGVALPCLMQFHVSGVHVYSHMCALVAQLNLDPRHCLWVVKQYCWTATLLQHVTACNVNVLTDWCGRAGANCKESCYSQRVTTQTGLQVRECTGAAYHHGHCHAVSLAGTIGGTNQTYVYAGQNKSNQPIMSQHMHAESHLMATCMIYGLYALW